MKAQDVKNITIKSLQIKIKEAAALGDTGIKVYYPLPEYIKNYFIKKGFHVSDYVEAEFASFIIIPSRPAWIYWK